MALPRLSDLPPELIQHIASYLPSVSSIVSLDLTCRSLHATISSDDYSIFGGFALTHFPSVTFSPLWREATRALTTRSRAWDRKAFVGRVLQPPSKGKQKGARQRPARQNLGYAPALDSYEEWTGTKWSDRKEVVAWGAGPKVIVRRRENRGKSEGDGHGDMQRSSTGVPVKTEWATMEGGGSAHEDILDLRLLRPSQQRQGDGEEFIIRRANHEVSKIVCDVGDNRFYPDTTYDVGDAPTEAMDLNSASEPLLAVCQSNSISLFQGSSYDGVVSPLDTIPRNANLSEASRARSLKFLSQDRFAVAEQLYNKTGVSPIRIYQVEEDEISVTTLTDLTTNSGNMRTPSSRISTTIAPLASTSTLANSPGHVFLAGWSDGIVRLHDDRAPASVTTYVDLVDDGPIAAVQPIGHESFIAGGHQNACVKLFDLRMGARPYSYLDARNQEQKNVNITLKNNPPPKVKQHPLHHSQPNTDMNLLLSIRMNSQTHLYDPSKKPPPSIGHGNRRPERPMRYAGSVYSLTLPSPSSRTIYAGIENHVVQLDLASTDDIFSSSKSSTSRLDHDWDLELSSPGMLELSAYNRPAPPGEGRDQYISETKVELRQQRPLKQKQGGKEKDEGGRRRGWDERWCVASYGRMGSAIEERQGDGRW